MSIFANIETEFEAIWTKFEGIFNTEIEPTLKNFLQQFATKDGQLILTSAIAAVGALTGGTPFATVAEELVTGLIKQSESIAEQSALTTLQQVQGALSVAKIAGAVVAPADTASVEKINGATSATN